MTDKTPLLNRYIWLVDTIYGAGSIPFEEIDERWQRSCFNKTGEALPERTFYRHRNAIQRIFGIEIKCNRHNGMYYISNTDDIEEDGMRKWMINTFAVSNLINESRQLRDRIVYEEVPSGQRFLTTILEAMREGVVLNIEYKGFDRERSSTFEVEPYSVKIFRQRWYLLARSEAYDALRVYALDRMESVEITEREFVLPEEFDARDFFADNFGIMVGERQPVERVEILIANSQSNYLRTLPLHASQREIGGEGEGTVFEFKLRPTFDFEQELRRYGADLEVRKPEWLREKFATEAAKTAGRYGK